MKLFLVGYRCTGKSTIGRRLACELQIPFQDTDEMVRQIENRSIEQIVSTQGWEAFRQHEQQMLQKTLALEAAVISTGGGIVLNPDNRKWMRSNGFCIWLSASENVILQRLSTDVKTRETRPRLSELDLLEETRQIMHDRLPLYEQVHHLKIDTGEKSVDECVNTICRRLKNVRF
jgi:shikimate kinase